MYVIRRYVRYRRYDALDGWKSITRLEVPLTVIEHIDQLSSDNELRETDRPIPLFYYFIQRRDAELREEA